jgi:hypothetical protein
VKTLIRYYSRTNNNNNNTNKTAFHCIITKAYPEVYKSVLRNVATTTTTQHHASHYYL